MIHEVSKYLIKTMCLISNQLICPPPIPQDCFYWERRRLAGKFLESLPLSFFIHAGGTPAVSVWQSKLFLV